MKIIENIALVFALAFALNFVWEHIHSRLYTAYHGKPITSYILFRAALFDAVVITLLYFIFLATGKSWVSIFLAMLFAIALELFALQTGRWEYNSLMPIIPVLKIGLTPVAQLPLLSYIIFNIVRI